MDNEKSQALDEVKQERGSTISMSPRARMTMKSLSDADATFDSGDVPPFQREIDVLRFACILAIRANGDTLLPIANEANSETYINIGSLDSGDTGATFSDTVSLLAPQAVAQERFTRVVRRYAEWGIAKMQMWHEDAMQNQSSLTLLDFIENSETLIAETQADESQDR
ncbi:hypothetical protein [Vreelandella massiliensis]|uniref:hypothetical protein n=1 Tax=Vreelandella massiliensis TaxID=1816686 RepID=UPI00096A9A94|nr:hypothetical protein [Halomonas massiliensis]